MQGLPRHSSAAFLSLVQHLLKRPASAGLKTLSQECGEGAKGKTGTCLTFSPHFLVISLPTLQGMPSLTPSPTEQVALSPLGIIWIVPPPFRNVVVYTCPNTKQPLDHGGVRDSGEHVNTAVRPHKGTQQRA